MLLKLLLAAILALPITSIAQAAPTGVPETLKCVKRVDLLASIKKSSNAQPLFVGIIEESLVMEVWKDLTSERWIAFMTNTKGVSCIVTEGNGLGFAGPKDAPAPSPKPEKKS